MSTIHILLNLSWSTRERQKPGTSSGLITNKMLFNTMHLGLSFVYITPRNCHTVHKFTLFKRSFYFDYIFRNCGTLYLEKVPRIQIRYRAATYFGLLDPDPLKYSDKYWRNSLDPFFSVRIQIPDPHQNEMDSKHCV